MKLAIFDFDGTLFYSPVPNRNRLDKTLYGKLMAKDSDGGFGWFQTPITLAPEYSTDLGLWFNPDVVADARKCIEDDDYITVMLTGRSIAFTDRIVDLCNQAGLAFDEYLLKPTGEMTTGAFKIAEIKRLIKSHGVDEVYMWEDRPRHIKKFDEYLSTDTRIKKYRVHHIHDGDRFLPADTEDALIAILVGSKPMMETVKPRTPSYYAIVLDDASRNTLEKYFKLYVPSESWKWHAHHMTIIFGGNFFKLPDLLSHARDLVGVVASLSVTHIGMNDKCIAVKVESDIPSQNETKHITLATSPTGKPRDSNSIDRWTAVAEKIPLSGTISAIFM